MRLLHLSDLHIGAQPKDNAIVQQRLDLIYRRFPEHILVITGDVIDNEGAVRAGTPLPPVPVPEKPFQDAYTEFQKAWQWPPLLPNVDPNAFPLNAYPPGWQEHINVARIAFTNARGMLERFWQRGQPIFICPGNHDYGCYGVLFNYA